MEDSFADAIAAELENDFDIQTSCSEGCML